MHSNACNDSNLERRGTSNILYHLSRDHIIHVHLRLATLQACGPEVWSLWRSTPRVCLPSLYVSMPMMPPSCWYSILFLPVRNVRRRVSLVLHLSPAFYLWTNMQMAFGILVRRAVLNIHAIITRQSIFRGLFMTVLHTTSSPGAPEDQAACALTLFSSA